MATIKDLPVELLLEITSHLQLMSDINALSQADSSFHSLCDPILYERIRTRVPDNPTNDQGLQVDEDGPLEWAAENGKHACALRLLQAGVPVWPCGNSPINTAAKRGDSEMVKILISHRPAMLNEHSLWRLRYHVHNSIYVATPLSYAIASGHDLVVEFLIKNNATTRFPDGTRHSYDDKPYLQPLDQAIIMSNNAFAAKLLFENSMEDYDFSSARYFLPIAARTSFEMFKIVMDAGSLPEFDDKDFWNDVLDAALTTGQLKTVKFLLECGISINTDASEEWDPESWGIGDPGNIFSKIGCTANHHPELISFLLQQVNIDDVVHGSSLHALICTISAAVDTCDEELLCRLLKVDWTTKKPSADRSQKLRWLEEICLYPLAESKSENTRMLNICLDHGIPITWVENMVGSPPVIVAAQQGKYEFVKILLERGGEPKHAPDYNGHTHDLTSLLHSTLDNHYPSLWDEPPEILDQRHKIVQLIMDRDIRGKRRTHFDNAILENCIDIPHKAMLDTLDEHHWLKIDPRQLEHEFLYHKALSKPNPLMIKRFLESGFDPNQLSDREPFELPLTSLGGYGDNAALSLVDYTTSVSLLLEYGANMEKRVPSSGLTPLFHLVNNPESSYSSESSVTRAQVLLEKGADPFSSCNGDTTLIEIAVSQGDIAVVKVLLEFFDKHSIPFEKVRDSIERALQASQSLRMECVLSRWYWRKRNRICG